MGERDQSTRRCARQPSNSLAFPCRQTAPANREHGRRESTCLFILFFSLTCLTIFFDSLRRRHNQSIALSSSYRANIGAIVIQYDVIERHTHTHAHRHSVLLLSMTMSSELMMTRVTSSSAYRKVVFIEFQTNRIKTKL